MPTKHTISISATLLSKYCSAVPQGHAIQSDWRRDEKLAQLMYSTSLLFIMAGTGFRGKLTGAPQTPSLLNEVSSPTKYTTEGIISKLITHKPGVYSHWDITMTMKHRVINVYSKLKGFLSEEIVVLLNEAASRTAEEHADCNVCSTDISPLHICCIFNSCSSSVHG